jgi:hypothetical protein
MSQGYRAINIHGENLTAEKIYQTLSSGGYFEDDNAAADYVRGIMNTPIAGLADAKANDFRFVGLSLDESGLKEYVERHQLKFPVYARLPAETVESLGLGSTPQTIVVSPEGEIVKVWSGAYIEDLRSEVEAYFGIQLPAVMSAGK